MANNTAYENGLANAFTNNTFDLPKVETAIKSTIENSFNYLKRLQRSYINICRFSLTEDDMYLTTDNKICVSLDKDFIETPKRKDYRLSSFYNKFVTIDTVAENQDIFSFIPLVFIDGKSIFSFKIKSSLDGHTVIMFTHIDLIKSFLNSPHSIEVVFLKNTNFYRFVTNKYALDSYNWILPISLTGITKKNGNRYFIFLRNTENKYGTNIFQVDIDNSGNLIIDKDNLLLYDFFINNREVEVCVVIPSNLYEIDGFKEIHNRIDNNRQSSLVRISPDENSYYTMPIPTHNLFILKVNKNSGEIFYENNKQVILHYPNIYEIMSDDEDPNEFEYKIFYFYRQMQDMLKYENHYEYIHRYFKRKMNTSFDKAFESLLYQKNSDENLQNYFFSIFDYEDADYVYNHGDFFNTKKPYDFDYKTDKLREFIDTNPKVLEEYGKEVENPHDIYFLSVKNIDLSKRIRNDTIQEAIKDSDKYSFNEPCYVFMFRNDGLSNLDLRFFIDGLLCTGYFQLHVNEIEYIYIPIGNIKEDSYIEVERFNTYTFLKTIKFNSISEGITIEFDKNEFIEPTLYDLFVTDIDKKTVSRSNFKIYALVSPDEYDISDYINDMKKDSYVLIDNSVIEDSETREIYVDIDELFNKDDKSILLDANDTYVDGSNTRLPLKYMGLTKIKVFCINEENIGKTFLFTINKIPYIYHKKMTKTGLPRIQLFNGSVPWRQMPSYVRTFVNGRFIPMDFDIYEETPMKTYFIPKCFINDGEVISIDISPYSYELEYHLEEIPEDFLISFNGELTKPFNTDYYDIYLNGRKLNDTNIQQITSDKIKLFNVSSRYNLYIYRRDRDFEYFGFNKQVSLPIDEVLNSDKFSDDDKNSIIDDIIYNNHDKEDVKEGTNTESNIDVLVDIDSSIFEKYRFYMDVIVPRGIARPNDFMINSDMIKNVYTEVYETYSNKYNRVVMRPNISYDAKNILMIGKSYEENFPSLSEKIALFMGDELEIKSVADGTLIGALVELYKQLGGISFKIEPNTLMLQAVYNNEESTD